MNRWNTYSKFLLLVTLREGNVSYYYLKCNLILSYFLKLRIKSKLHKRIETQGVLKSILVKVLSAFSFFFSILNSHSWHGCLPFRVISGILDEIDESIQKSTLLKDLKMSQLPVLCAKCITLLQLLVNSLTSINLLLSSYNQFLHLLMLSVLTHWFIKVEGKESLHNKVVLAIQDIFELVTTDMMLNGSRLDF